MTTMNAHSERRFYRDADRAMLGGVCAGLAAYLGFNLKMTRFLAFIAFLMAMPIAVIGYLAAVFLIPSATGREFDAATETHRQARHEPKGRRTRRRARKEHEEAADAPKSSVAADVDRRCQSMDQRLARLEKHVTSKRFQIEQELERL